MGPFEAQLREFIRRLDFTEHEVWGHGRKLTAIRQNLRDADDTGIKAKLARISGAVDGCASEGFPGATVAIYHHDTGVKLGELTCDGAGLYEGRVGLDSNPQDVDIVATPTGTYAARFAGPVVTPATLSVGANPVPPIVIPPTADWCCGETDYFPGECGPVICETGRICVTVQQTSCSVALEGVTVTVTDDAEPPNIIGTGTTVGSPGKYCVDIPEAGTYHVATSVPGLADRTAIVDAVCGIDNGVTITYPANSVGQLCFICNECDCDGNNAVAATITVGGWPGTITTDPVTGQGCMVVKASTAFSVTATYPSGFTETLDFQAAPPCGTNFVTFQSVLSISISAIRCAPGCSVTFTASGAASGSCGATESGPDHIAQCCLVFSNPITTRAPGEIITIATSGGGFNDGLTVSGGGCWSTAFPLSIDMGNTC